MSPTAALPRRCLAVSLAAAFGAAAFGWVLSGLSAVPADASNTACVTRDFKTELVRSACARGGQAEAKKVMKRFTADAKARVRKPGLKAARNPTCDSCHTRLAPRYPLTGAGLELFKRMGGK